jgi:hypothetical protein
LELAEKVGHLEMAVAVHTERLDNIEAYQEKQNGTLAKIQNELQLIRKDFGNRPSWVVTIVITILSTLCTGMAVYILTH